MLVEVFGAHLAASESSTLEREVAKPAKWEEGGTIGLTGGGAHRLLHRTPPNTDLTRAGVG